MGSLPVPRPCCAAALAPGPQRHPVAVETAAQGCARRPSCERYRSLDMELPDPVRLRLGNFSRTVFSDSSRTGPEYNEGPGEWPRPRAGSLAHRRTSAGFGAARFYPDLKWRFRLQLVLRSVGSTLEDRPGQELGLGLGRIRALISGGPGLMVLRPGQGIAS